MTTPPLPFEESELEHASGKMFLEAARLNLLPLERLAMRSNAPLTRNVAGVLLAAARMVNELVEAALKDGGHS